MGLPAGSASGARIGTRSGRKRKSDPASTGPPRNLAILICRRDGRLRRRRRFVREHTNEAARAALILKLYNPGDAGKQRVVFALADVYPRLMLGAALADQNGACLHEL